MIPPTSMQARNAARAASSGDFSAPDRRAVPRAGPGIAWGLACVGLLAAQWPAAAADPAVTVYRCSDSNGQLVALRDSPCRSGERQETVQMQRPQDPPARSASTAAPAPGEPAATAPAREVRVVTVQAPAPLYECVAQDGSTYLSETRDGTQRWVPLWTMGYPARPGPRPLPRNSAPPVSPRASVRPPVGGPRPPLPGVIVPAGTWVQDACMRLSPEEVCGRLSDRHYEILRIYHAAMPSERDQLDREQRQVDAHLADHCPGY